MKRLVRIVLLAVGVLLLALVAVGILAAETGPAEKVVLAACGAAILAAAATVRRRLA